MKKQNEGVIPFLKTLSCPEVKLIIDKNWSFIFVQIISNELPIEKNAILYILLHLNEKLSLNTNICFFYFCIYSVECHSFTFCVLTC